MTDVLVEVLFRVLVSAQARVVYVPHTAEVIQLVPELLVAPGPSILEVLGVLLVGDQPMYDIT